MFISLLIFSILIPPLGLFCGLFGLVMDRKHWKGYVFCLALTMASIAYCYYPKGDPDIIRYIAHVKQIGRYSLPRAMTIGIHGEANLYTFTFVCWVIAKLGDPQLLPALSVFCVYYVAFYITCKLAEDTHARSRNLIFYLLFIICSLNLYEMINNVRNVCAFALVSFAVFREMYMKKRDILTLVLYVFPLFLHTSAILLVLIRLIVKYTGKIKLVLFLLVSNVMLLIDLAYAIVTRIGSGNIVISLIRNLVVKGYIYFHNTTSDWGRVVSNSLSYKVERVANVALAFIVSYLIFYIAQKKITAKGGGLLALLPWESERLHTNQFVAWNNYCFMLALSTIACLPMIMPEYWRFFSITVICSSLPFLILTEQRKQFVRLRGFLIFAVTPLCFMLMLKFILYSDRKALLLGPFVSSPLLVAGKSLVHLFF